MKILLSAQPVGKTMKFDPKIHNRHSIRLQGYDYSRSGAYYITIVTHGRECLFGQVDHYEMHLNQFGQIVQKAWFDLPNHYPHVELGEFCIMPNHVHGVILLIDDGRGGSIGKMPVPDKTFPAMHLCRPIHRPAPTTATRRLRKTRPTHGINAIHYPKSCAHSNRFRQDGSTHCEKYRAFPSGSAIIMNTSSVTRTITTASNIISNPTLSIGWKITKTPGRSHDPFHQIHYRTSRPGLVQRPGLYHPLWRRHRARRSQSRTRWIMARSFYRGD